MYNQSCVEAYDIIRIIIPQMSSGVVLIGSEWITWFWQSISSHNWVFFQMEVSYSRASLWAAKNMCNREPCFISCCEQSCTYIE